MRRERESTKREKKDGPYWSWVYQHSHVEEGAIVEPVEANPDVLTEDQTLWQPRHSSEELEALREVLDEGGLQVLSEREREVFQLVLIEGRSQRTVAKLLHIKRPSVQSYLLSGARKLRRLCQPKL